MTINIPQCTAAPTKRCFLPWRSRGGKCQTQTHRCQMTDSLRPRRLQIPNNSDRHQWQQVYVSVLMIISWPPVPSQPVARLPVPKHAQLFIMPLTHEVWSQPSSTPLYTTYAVHMNSGKSWMQDWTTMLSSYIMSLFSWPGHSSWAVQSGDNSLWAADWTIRICGPSSSQPWSQLSLKVCRGSVKMASNCGESSALWRMMIVHKAGLQQPKCFHNVLAHKTFY